MSPPSLQYRTRPARSRSGPPPARSDRRRRAPTRPSRANGIRDPQPRSAPSPLATTSRSSCHAHADPPRSRPPSSTSSRSASARSSSPAPATPRLAGGPRPAAAAQDRPQPPLGRPLFRSSGTAAPASARAVDDYARHHTVDLCSASGPPTPPTSLMAASAPWIMMAHDIQTSICSCHSRGRAQPAKQAYSGCSGNATATTKQTSSARLP